MEIAHAAADAGYRVLCDAGDMLGADENDLAYFLTTEDLEAA